MKISSEHSRRQARQRVIVVLMFASLLLLLLVALAAGDSWLTPGQVVDGLTGADYSSNPTPVLLIRYARLPRILLAMLVGSALAVAGLLMQTLSRNPLATPSVLGIGNGANLGLVLAIVSIPALSEPVAVAASFLGAVVSALIIGVMGFSGSTQLDRDRLIVGGTILATFEGSLVVGILFFNQMHNVMLGWTIGRLIHVDWFQLRFVTPMIGFGLLLAALLVERLEAFRLGMRTAQGLGISVGQVQTGVVLVVVLLAGGSVAAAGPVAFVGLIVPHLIRRSVFSRPRIRFLVCILGGAMLTVSADLLSRLTSQGRLIPMGIWTMSLGALFFMSLSFRGSRSTLTTSG